MYGKKILFYKKIFIAHRLPVLAVPLPGVRNTELQITPKITVFHKLFFNTKFKKIINHFMCRLAVQSNRTICIDLFLFLFIPIDFYSFPLVI